MAQSFLSNLKYILLLAAIIGVSILLRDFAQVDPELIKVNGDAVIIIDGDSFKSSDDEFRLRGIDAPEFMQTCSDGKGKPWKCGHFARQKLQDKLRDQQFICEVFAVDKYDRKIVTCSSPKTPDLSSWLVAEGAAVSGRNYSEIIYAQE